MASNLIYVLIVLGVLVWLLQWRRKLDRENIMESPMDAPFIFMDQMKFELRIYLSGDAASWCDSHMLTCRPERDTVKALLAEATETYIALFDMHPNNWNASLKQLEIDEDQVLLTN